MKQSHRLPCRTQEKVVRRGITLESGTLTLRQIVSTFAGATGNVPVENNRADTGTSHILALTVEIFGQRQ